MRHVHRSLNGNHPRRMALAWENLGKASNWRRAQAPENPGKRLDRGRAPAQERDWIVCKKGCSLPNPKKYMEVRKPNKEPSMCPPLCAPMLLLLSGTYSLLSFLLNSKDSHETCNQGRSKQQQRNTFSLCNFLF